MWQFENAEMRLTLREALGIWQLALRGTTRSDCRRAATHGAPSIIATLPHSQIIKLKKAPSGAFFC
jgi:hypothetical protein